MAVMEFMIVINAHCYWLWCVMDILSRSIKKKNCELLV